MSAVDSNITLMNSRKNFDVIIICTSTEHQANYWRGRLQSGLGTWLPATTKVTAVNEDWDGGAGNGLGTLYAFLKASKVLNNEYGIDILDLLKNDLISIGLFHSAGKGTRLAPLPGAENNNKPGVKLSSTILLKDGPTPITILEGVIKQTGCYASSRRGRLSVFWGDQVFIPSSSVTYEPSHHADILCKLGPMVDEKEWKEKGYQSYGLIVQGIQGECAQVEKVDHATAMSMLKSFGDIKSVGASLGSFSLSSSLLNALIKEFDKELKAKKGKMDSDPHWWMPITLDREVYVQVMSKKGVETSESGSHFDRIAKMMKNFRNEDANSKNLGTFGAVDVGMDCCWWDYGRLSLYQTNSLLLAENSTEGERMRKFFGINTSFISKILGSKAAYALGLSGRINDSKLGSTCVDSHSIVMSSKISSGSIKGSIVNNVRCKDIQADGCILVNVTAESIRAEPGSIIYNVYDNKFDQATDDVSTGVFRENNEPIIMKSALKYDGGKEWHNKILNNKHCFDDIYKLNSDANPTKLEKTIKSSHDSFWSTIPGSANVGEECDLKLMATLGGALAAVVGAAFMLSRRNYN